MHKTAVDMTKALLDNVILEIKINTFKLSLREIHDNLAKCTTIPESDLAVVAPFEFVECIDFVVKTGFE